MQLFFKGIIIGIAKIIPGVSGAIVAINFNVYEKLVDALTNFFPNWKANLKFLIILFMGILLSLIFASKFILFLLMKIPFITLMFFIGLLIGGSYNFGKSLTYNYKTIIIGLLFFLGFTILSLLNINNNYILGNHFRDNIIFFLGGIIEIMASIFPGISATSLLMLLGIYQHVLELISNIINISYITSHLLMQLFLVSLLLIFYF